MSYEVIETPCPACGNHVSILLYDGGKKPMATLCWPQSYEEAAALPAFPLKFVQCVFCTHVYNCEFNYADVPYRDKYNLMYNNGHVWQKHLESIQSKFKKMLPDNPCVIEIGSGDGSFIRRFSQVYNGSGEFIGYDPNALPENSENLHFFDKYFFPEKHITSEKPDMIILRHILEHLSSPIQLLQKIVFSASRSRRKILLYVEVPCIDNALSFLRTSDYYYEHNSHFTYSSFKAMISKCSKDIVEMGMGYNGEVVSCLCWIGNDESLAINAERTVGLSEKMHLAHETIGNQLKELARNNSVALWGGTGKGASFMMANNMNKDDFPIVVDSDVRKVGTHVPLLGQEILPATWLLSNNIDTIFIITQWRASDIVAEIESLGISYRKILLEHNGQLVDFHSNAHPYRFEMA